MASAERNNPKDSRAVARPTLRNLATSPQEMTPVGFEPTPLRTGALSQRLRPLGQSVLPRTNLPRLAFTTRAAALKLQASSWAYAYATFILVRERTRE